jgi:hypothetical protein
MNRLRLHNVKESNGQNQCEDVRLEIVRRSPTYRLLLQRDCIFLFLFALYGLAAGIITYIGGLSYDENDIFSSMSYLINFPTFLVLFGFEWFAANPNGFSILDGDIGTWTLMLGSVAVWFGWTSCVRIRKDAQDGTIDNQGV